MPEDSTAVVAPVIADSVESVYSDSEQLQTIIGNQERLIEEVHQIGVYTYWGINLIIIALTIWLISRVISPMIKYI